MPADWDKPSASNGDANDRLFIIGGTIVALALLASMTACKLDNERRTTEQFKACVEAGGTWANSACYARGRVPEVVRP